MVSNVSEALQGVRDLWRVALKLGAFCFTALTVLALAAVYALLRGCPKQS